ncbi:hypothetical protein [Streptomyces sp. NBC_00162]|uniref:hypothetical protein n=1 Tax=Streptomyces sp. NBC_00162 TaxID=2903629 RepID=UPI00214C2745|nr:hypothetical protein [Streptomyces sp. NBC_00162]UUU44198.1 hypothetical protein JIW86_38790 [Streptomyces sp. NBC_00162]
MSVDGVRDRIAAAAGVSSGDVKPSRGKVRVTIREEDLPALAGLDEVRQIEEVPEKVLYNTMAATLMHAHVSLNGTKFRGEGQIVCVADTGFDKGSTTNVHPAFAGRVKRLVALGRKSPRGRTIPPGTAPMWRARSSATGRRSRWAAPSPARLPRRDWSSSP